MDRLFRLVVAITPFTVLVATDPLKASVFVVVEVRPVSVVVAITPFTVVVRIFVVVAKFTVFEFTKVEVDITPFTDEVAMLPPVVKELFEITELVATTPFTVVVRVLPERV